jgi:hypothetical protein
MRLPKFLSKTFIEDAPDLKRRGFLFGALATTLVVAAPKSFFIMPPAPRLIMAVDPVSNKLLLDLPLQQMMAILRKLDEQVLDVSAIPRWVVINKDHYDMLVGENTRFAGPVT